MGTTPYRITPADRATAPRTLADEERYLKYRDQDRAKPYASFFRERTAPMPEHVVHALLEGMSPPEYGFDLDEAASHLQRSGTLPLETGWTHVGPRVFVAVHTPMPGVTAAMWDWWFGWHSRETQRYKLWYPDAHQFTAVGDDRSADRTLTDRQRYIDNVSYVDEYIGGRLNKLAIRFVDPAGLGFDDRPGTTHVCARVGLSNLPIGFGWLVHQIRPTEDGSEMRSRFFLNDVSLLDLPPGAQQQGPGFRAVTSARRIGVGQVSAKLTARLLPADVGPAMIHHCSREMNHLAGFLPQLFDAFHGTP